MPPKRSKSKKKPPPKRPKKKPTKAKLKGRKAQKKPTLKQRIIHKRPKIANYLIGPVKMDILERKSDNKKIVVFGDVHILAHECPKQKQKSEIDIIQYLDQLFRQYKGPEPLDVFIESKTPSKFDEKQPQRPPVDPMDLNDNYLLRVRRYLQTCLQVDKKQCPFYGKPIRFHYADTRRGMVHSGTDNKTQELIKVVRQLKPAFRYDRKVEMKHIEILRQLVQHYLDGDVDYFFRYSKINKQIDKIKDPQIKQLLYKYMSDYMQKERLRVEHELEAVKWITMLFTQNKEDNRILDTFKVVYEYIVGQMLSPLFDIYTLARIIGSNMKRVLIYAGDAHSRKIVKFLVDHLGFTNVLSRQSNDEVYDWFTQKRKPNATFQCLDMHGVSQLF